MSIEETERILKLIKEAIKDKRSKKDITETFKNAGIITRNGDLRSPYKDICLPVKK